MPNTDARVSLIITAVGTPDDGMDYHQQRVPTTNRTMPGWGSGGGEDDTLPTTGQAFPTGISSPN